MLIEAAQAGGVIDDAPTVADVLSNAFAFLLQIGGIVGIIGVVLAGMLYFFAGGDQGRIKTAKKMSVALITGAVILFGAWVIVKAISRFFI